MKEIYYKVADHVFALEIEESDRDLLCDLRQYEPFVTDPTEDTVFRLRVSRKQANTKGFVQEVEQNDGAQSIHAGRIGMHPCFMFLWQGALKAVLVCNKDFQKGDVYVDDYNLFGINNAVMVLYALATANRRTALFHSSVVSFKDNAYMFLGPSGTGKSTHARLWLEHIEGTELVNDDNPVVRVLDDGSIRVYGSPWSGKTPCYRNVSYPVGAIVMLRQAPRNIIVRLRPTEAFAALVDSISGMRWNQMIAKGLYETEVNIIAHVMICHLDCLPDEEAARLCMFNVSG